MTKRHERRGKLETNYFVLIVVRQHGKSVSERIDKGYTEVISLQYVKRTKRHERVIKMEMNSFLLIVLLTL